MIGEAVDDPRDEVAREGQRVVDRLRSMPLTRLTGDVAGRARALAQALADRAADLEGRPRRPVPDIGDPAVGDQVAVMVTDLLALDLPDDDWREVARELRHARRVFP
jgi:hypothetical protein